MGRDWYDRSQNFRKWLREKEIEKRRSRERHANLLRLADVSDLEWKRIDKQTGRPYVPVAETGPRHMAGGQSRGNRDLRRLS